MNRKTWSLVCGLLILSLACNLMTGPLAAQTQPATTAAPASPTSPLSTSTTEPYVTSTPAPTSALPSTEFAPVASAEIDGNSAALIDTKDTDEGGQILIEDVEVQVRIHIKVLDAKDARPISGIHVHWESYNGEFIIIAADPGGRYLPSAQHGSYTEITQIGTIDHLVSSSRASAIQGGEDLLIIIELLEGLDNIKDFGGLVAYLADWPDIVEHAEFKGGYTELCLTGDEMANLFSGGLFIASLLIPGSTTLAGSDEILAAALAISMHLFQEGAESKLKALEGRHRLRFYNTPLPWMILTVYRGACEEVAQIGYYRSIYLRYDPAEWESFNETQDDQLVNENGELIESLRHREIPGCILHDNLGFGPPLSWNREDANRTIGALEYRVETWTDTATRKPVLIVYQYPTGPSGYGDRIELRIDQKPKLCIENAEEALALSEDLIAGLDFPRPAEIGPEAIWRPPSSAFAELQNCYASTDSRINCVAALIAKYGASEQAIAFTQRYEAQFFLDSFAEKGRVDVGAVFYPNRANDNLQGVLLNGTPELIHVEEAWDIDITQHPDYASLAGKQSNLILWTSDNGLEAVQSLPGGGQRFVISYPLYKGCHACGIGGYGLVAFDFDDQGQFLGKSLLALGASKPAVPSP